MGKRKRKIRDLTLFERYKHTLIHTHVQWNLSNPDTNGTDQSVIVSEVSSVQGLKRMQEWYLGWEKAVLFREVSSVQGSGIEGFHCTHTHSRAPLHQ